MPLNRRIALWLAFNVPLGRLNPWLLGYAINRKPHRHTDCAVAPLKGLKIHGPDGMGYEITRDLVRHTAIMAADFKAFGGAPEPRTGEQVPIWLSEPLIDLASRLKTDEKHS